MLAIFRRSEPVAVKLDELSDEELMIRYRDGELRAFEVLLERHRQPVFNFLYRFVHERTQAEDLLQEVFLRVVRNAEGYQPRARFTTWMYTIARNLAIDQTRKAKHQRAVSLDQPVRGKDNDGDGSTLLSLLAAPGGKSDQKLADRQFAASLYRALEELPADQREVFLLREYQALPFQEIAEIVGAPVNTVKSRMRYALEGLRRRLAEHQDAGMATETVSP